MRSDSKHILGIDAGGSSGKFAFSDSNGVRTFPPGPSCTVTSPDDTEGVEKLGNYIKKQLNESRLPAPQLIRASVAGCANPNHAEAAGKTFSRIWPGSDVEIHSDAAAAFSAVHGKHFENKALLICGSGSVLAYESGGMLHLLGGYGPATDEYGSARMISREVLTRTGEYIDAGESGNELCITLEKNGIRCGSRPEFQESLRKFPGGLHHKTAPLCLNLAAEGNQFCINLIQRQTEALARMLQQAQKLNSQLSGIGFHGGLFHHTYFRKRVAETFAKLNPDLCILDTTADVEVYFTNPEIARPLPIFIPKPEPR